MATAIDGDRTQNPRRRGGARTILREPLFHFVVIGLALFALYSLRADPAPRPDAPVIVVTPERIDRLRQSFEGVWRRPPTEDELAGLTDDFLREEVYYREALALGLDRNDSVIRRRLRQKMEFLTESAAGSLEATSNELSDFYEENLAEFTPPLRIAFDQVFLGEAPDGHVIDAARAMLNTGTDPQSVGQPSLMPSGMAPSPEVAVDGAFGIGFFDQIAAFDIGIWQGPVRSGYGVHLVYPLERSEPSVPTLDDVRPEIEAAWRRQRAEELREESFAALLDRYEVIIETKTPDAVQ